MNPPEDTEILALIGRLDHSECAARERAATRIFAIGSERAQTAAAEWFRDKDLASCFVGDASGFPEATVGIAVNPDKFARIRLANDMPRLADVPPDLDAEEFELRFAADVRLDVLTTRDRQGNGAIARFLKKRGEGIQQVELLVNDLDRATNILRGQFGAAPVYAEGRRGADETRVNFFLVATPTSEKLLIELVELPS